ncbi:hypothetical protein R1sor_015780 [Riccia sorocarpa]|uniref:Uncharacterized protein n=1 Tax=Riccia sorocarpa TaxID=122646 RepID=A0ABD3HHC1_9MARC
MGREDVAYVDAGGPAFFLNRSVSPASSCSSSSSNSEMKPQAMARSLGAQKNAARHRMTKQDYEMIVTYLENPDNFAAIRYGDAFSQTVRAVEDGGHEMGNQTGRSSVDVETNMVRTPQQNRRPQQSRGDASVQSVDDVRSSGKTVRSRDRPPPPERKTSLITAYEEQVKEKLFLKKEAQDQKADFMDAILEDRRQAREQRERESQNSGRDRSYVQG